MKKSIRTAEWVSLILSVVVILAIAGYLVAGIINRGKTSDALAIEITKKVLKTEGDRALVLIEVFNKGNQAAHKLKIKALDSEIEFDYIGAGSKDKAYLFVSPNEVERLEPQATSYLVE